MRHLSHLFGILAAGLLCGGCVPIRIVSSPGASGMVFDAQTHAPIRGAQAIVCTNGWFARGPQTTDQLLMHTRSPRVVTKASGKFSIGDAHGWILYPHMALMPASGELIIMRDGYEPAHLRLTADPKWTGGFGEFLNGDITNLAAFTAKLKTPSDPVSEWLAGRLSEDARTAMVKYPATDMDRALLQSILVKEFNTVINGPVIYETNRFRAVNLSSNALEYVRHEQRLREMTGDMDEQTYRQTYPNATTPAQLRAEVNRVLLDEAYPNELSSKQGNGHYRNVGIVLLKPIGKGSGLAENEK